MTQVVLDTNVLVSGFLATRGPLSDIVTALLRNEFRLITSHHILIELERVLERPFFLEQQPQEAIDRYLTLIRRRAEIMTIDVIVHGVATQPADDQVLATAVSGRADYLVTGDRQLLVLGAYQQVKIVTPREFLDLLSLADDG